MGGVDAGMTAGRPMPTQDDVLGYFNTLSNWGRWGDDDELGTLNHITEGVRDARSCRDSVEPATEADQRPGGTEDIPQPVQQPAPAAQRPGVGQMGDRLLDQGAQPRLHAV